MRQRYNATIISHQRLGFAAVALAAACWAGAAVVARGLFERGVPPLHLAGARAVVAACGFAALAALRRDAPARGAMRALIPLGIAIALVNAAYYLAIDRLAVAVAVILQYTAPILVVAWAAVALRRRPRADVLVALALSVSGVVLVSFPGAGSAPLDPLGLVFGLASALFFALYSLISERAGARHGPVAALRGAFAVAAAFWVVVLAPRGVPAPLVDPANLAGVLFVGLAGTLLPFLLYLWGMGRVQAERATIAATLEPVLAAVVAWLWLGQALAPAQILGGGLVVAAVALLQARRAEVVRPPEV